MVPCTLSNVLFSFRYQLSSSLSYFPILLGPVSNFQRLVTRVIIREDPREVSVYIADYIISKLKHTSSMR
ncbi:hypothetical protein N7519_003858 [Penicillium mononematosum]|uniref:uncharacterized protein n=1 Tax=Penicillium mononematosum TaxID=268346 RepID=UPI0025478CA5|nr:uncharacterized protein N7519_003858 [Penicillium mononematosum]KAJ6188950.1 hypothetical protein N7519_003858 [Penicillium mononematosum]